MSSLHLSLDVDDAPPGPPNPGINPHVIHHGVDAERSPHHKQVVDRQSHTTTNIPIIMLQIQSRVPFKNGNKLLYAAKITRELLLCATAGNCEEELKK